MEDCKRRCRSASPGDPALRCSGEVTDLAMHVEDHWAYAAPGVIVRWPHADLANPERVKAGDTQVGGLHYRTQEIQPWDIISSYALSYFTGNVVNYVLRAGRKGSRLEDLKKARHYLDKAIELEEKEE